MFDYTEEKRFCGGGRGEDPFYEYVIDIWKDHEKVGRVEKRVNRSGELVPCAYWHKETPIEVAYYEPKSSFDTYQRFINITYCRTVAEGKQIFARWYAEHADLCTPRRENVAALPASENAEFYPTPSELAGQMAGLVKWDKVQNILEPSAGKGDLIECACRAASKMRGGYLFRDMDKIAGCVDCVEYDENLRHVLTGKGFRVVHNDFLTMNTQKHYDLILMNPPFSNGDEHLLKAISMQKSLGGQIVCLLNAETIRNPYTNRRKLLNSILGEYGATIKFVSNAFSRAQRKTDVEVAIVYLNMPAEQRKSIILEGLTRAADEKSPNSAEPTAMVTGDWVDRLVAAFNMEAKAGVALMEEYNALAPYIMTGTGTYDRPMIQLSIKEHSVSFCSSETINDYLKMLRYKYWSMMLSREELTSRMTSQIQSEYQDKVRELQDYDFSRVNVERIIREITSQLSRGVEDSIEKLFDELSVKHSWYPECEKNVHYYNGWATNKAHKVNSKVILPVNGFYACYDGKKKLEAREFVNTICDIERALSYLDGEGAISRIDPYSVAQVSERNQRTSMTFSYFDATFYKKGTCHIKFHPHAQILLDRLNIFAARNRSWLPPTYGKKHYEQMNSEEQAVVDSFQGREAYEQIMSDPSRYIVAPGASVPMLTA